MSYITILAERYSENDIIRIIEFSESRDLDFKTAFDAFDVKKTFEQINMIFNGYMEFIKENKDPDFDDIAKHINAYISEKSIIDKEVLYRNMHESIQLAIEQYEIFNDEIDRKKAHIIAENYSNEAAGQIEEFRSSFNEKIESAINEMMDRAVIITEDSGKKILAKIEAKKNNIKVF